MKYVNFFFILALLAFACHSLKNGQNSEPSEDFNQFYLQFHSDSGFQMERIHFPLEGGSYDNEKEMKWNKMNWQQIKYTVYEVDTTQFKVEFNLTDTLVNERIYIPNSGFDFQCKYKLIDGKWFLVYCMDQNF